MFSYLHGIRPSNRRSAIPPATHPHNHNALRFYHETPPNSNGFNFDPPSSRHSQPSSLNEASPISPAPPLLPPIPRIASQHESSSNEASNRDRQQPEVEGAAQHGKVSLEGVLTPTSSDQYEKKWANLMSPGPEENNLQPSGVAPPPVLSEQPRPAGGRQKRPIDVKFEQMKAYSEPPFRPSIHTPQETVPSVSQPYRLQPLPPKILQTSSPPKFPPFSSERQRKEPVPPLRRPSELRDHTQVERDHDDLHRRQSIRPPRLLPEISSQSTSANQYRHSKAKLNLLNPMTLLARRRSHQAVEASYAESQHFPALQIPDDYDPRIRGKVVHDFSAPRSEKVLSGRSNDEPSRDGTAGETTKYSVTRRGGSPGSPDRKHAPLFTENFDDGLEKSQDPAKRSSIFLHQIAAQAAQTQPDPSLLPAFARKLPSNIATDLVTVRQTSSSPPNAPLTVVLESPEKHQTPDLPSRSMSPPQVVSTGTSIHDGSAQGLGSPKRYKSNASRFSFDLAGVGSSAQERLLEDKHRQKANRGNRESNMSYEGTDDQYDDFGYDNMDGNGYEERIPGVNCDDDEADTNGPRMPVLQREMENFNLVSPNKSSLESTSSTVSTSVTSLDTSRDYSNQLSFFAVSKLSPSLPQLQSGVPVDKKANDKKLRPRSTPSGSSTAVQAQTLQREVASETNLAGLPQRFSYTDDDMYFDDGMIDDMGDVSDQDFDEAVFDDNDNGLYGLPLRDRTLKPLGEPGAGFSEDSEQQGVDMLVPQHSSLGTRGGISISPNRSLSSEGSETELRDALTDLNQPNRPVFSQGAGLTQDNLAAYNQNALSAAVNQAAKSGAFDRTTSLQSSPPPIHGDTSLSPSLIPHQMNDDRPEAADFNDYEDDGLDDDPIVAAANAEALENDDDGFYGQEFGFFAKASGSCGTEYSNGGFFGPRALEGVHRSHSGKINFQEPSLTPITERSEWSNRNSTVALAMQGYPLSAVTTASPQFDHVPLDDVNMQLAMLRNLRRGAWGGSNASLQSSSNSQNSGSPTSHLPPNMVLPSPLQASSSNANLQKMASSVQNFGSSSGLGSSNESDPSPAVDSPTITFASGLALPLKPAPLAIESPTQPMSIPPRLTMPPPPIPAVVGLDQPALVRSGRSTGHSRDNSGAESVSYKEEGGKWFIEKRRTSETGEQILGRSLVEGGRI